jgi:4-methoxybenzoate monooxygenase (O-demethylating)
VFDLQRPAVAQHMAFGQMIARLEAECLIAALLRRVRSLSLAGEPEYRPVNTLRILDRLPLRVEPA